MGHSRPPSARHSYGYGRVELFAAVINALATGANSLYAGGQFQTLANKTMNNIARYDGNGWQVMSSGVNGTGTNSSLVTAIGATTTQIIVGGQFDFAGEGRI